MMAVVTRLSPLLVGPQMACTLSWLIISCVAFTALVGSPWVSRVMISTLRPRAPPAALIASAAKTTPRLKPMAGAELGPLSRRASRCGWGRTGRWPGGEAEPGRGREAGTAEGQAPARDDHGHCCSSGVGPGFVGSRSVVGCWVVCRMGWVGAAASGAGRARATPILRGRRGMSTLRPGLRGTLPLRRRGGRVRYPGQPPPTDRPGARPADPKPAMATETGPDYARLYRRGVPEPAPRFAGHPKFELSSAAITTRSAPLEPSWPPSAGAVMRREKAASLSLYNLGLARSASRRCANWSPTSSRATAASTPPGRGADHLRLLPGPRPDEQPAAATRRHRAVGGILLRRRHLPFRKLGANTVPMPLDAEGIRMDALSGTLADA